MAELHAVLLDAEFQQELPPPSLRCGTIHGLIEEAVDLYPQRVAVEAADGRCITYADLDLQANRLAKYLKSTGTPAGSIVGLCFRRQPDLIVAMLGILKAGCAYMPLDPTYPPDRLTYMVSHSQAALVLTEPDLAGLFHDTSVGIFTEIMAGLPSAWGTRVYGRARASDLAYVIYTSGSTGAPKGVSIEHRSLVNYVLAVADVTPLTPADRVLQFSTISFDAAAEEIFPCLASGATLVMMPPPANMSLAELVEFFDAKSITFTVLTTGYWNVLVDYLSHNREAFPSSLTTVVFGGERAQRRWVELWCSVAPQTVRLINAYGPTETTIAVVLYEVPRNFGESVGPNVPIGYPLANVAVHVLDSEMREMATGEVGELWVGGRCLGRGYLNDPNLTSSKFVADPLGTGARLYRTGDLACVNLRGELEILGRTDGQIKVRGFLVEPIEIERALDEIPGLHGAVVKMWPDPDGLGAGRLVAYVLASGTERIDERSVRQHLATRLPEYMVPSRIVNLNSFPLTLSGKIDVAALPLPPIGGANAGVSGGACGSAVEQFLIDLWQDLLALDAIGPNDNFFELGGNSLIAARMVGRVQKKLGAVVYMTAIFEAATAHGFAKYLIGNYTSEIRRVFPEEHLGPLSDPRVDAAVIARFRNTITSAISAHPLTSPGERNPRAIFVLSPPRSGSTLTRILLGGHPRLFAPPELQLLLFNTLAERAAFFAKGRLAFYLEGAIRAVMEAEAVTVDEAQATVQAMTRAGMTTKAFYRYLQDAVAPSLLVDKTASYVLDPLALRRIEDEFDAPFYVHLVRHPLPTISSFVETRMDQGFFLYEHDFTVRQLAELVWQVGHQNIVDFLHDIPENRQLSLRYETLVGQPADEMRRLCTAVGIEFDPSMVDAYDKQTRRMTDPARPGSLMVGDTKFHQHGRIDKRLADGSAVQASMADFSAETRRLAEQLGYAASEEVEAPTTGPALVGVKSLSKRTLVCFQPRGCGTPMFFVHGVGGSVPNFRFLPDVFGPERPFFALQAPALEAGGEQFASIAEIAAAYVTVIRGHAASGPYLLGGWSFGGIVAWEMAQQLRAEGADVPVLVLLDSYAPEHFVADDAEMMVRFSFDFVASLGKYEHVVTRNDLLAAPPERWPSMVLDAGAKAGLIPAGLVDPERFAKLHLVYRAHVRAAQGYYPKPYGGVVLNIMARESTVYRSDGVWTRFAPESTVSARIPGDHDSCLRPPNITALAEAWQSILKQVEAK